MTATDSGPGINDIRLVLQDGYTTSEDLGLVSWRETFDG